MMSGFPPTFFDAVTLRTGGTPASCVRLLRNCPSERAHVVGAQNLRLIINQLTRHGWGGCSKICGGENEHISDDELRVLLIMPGVLIDTSRLVEVALVVWDLRLQT